MAGVQYQAVDVFRLESGRHVSLRKGSYRGEICYEVLSMDGARIGFVPRSMLAVVMTHGASSGLLRAVQPHAVPWKQVQIEIIADRT